MTAFEDSSKGDRQEELTERFEFIQKVADLSPNILFVIDLQATKIIYLSKKVKDLLGYDNEYLLGLETDVFNKIIHPEDYDRRMENLHKCKSLADEEECEVEVRFISHDKTWKWFKIKERVFSTNQLGEVTQILGIAQNIHEQKKGEKKLLEEHERLENAQKIGHIGSFERKLPGNVMKFSNELYRIFGIEPRAEGISVDEFYSFVHPDDRKPLQEAVDKTHATGKPFDTITRIIRPDKSIRYTHRRAALNSDEFGNPVKVYGTMQDITRRILAEEEKNRIENLMRSAEILAGMGSYEIDLATGTVYFSDGLYKVFGEEAYAVKPSLEWMDQRSHPDDVDVINRIKSREVGELSSYTYTRRIYKKDGSLRILQAHEQFLPGLKGNSAKILGHVQDITERNKTEETIQQMLNGSISGITILESVRNDKGKIVDFRFMGSNKTAEITMGLSKEDLLGNNLLELFPGTKDVFFDFYVEVVETGKPIKLQRHYTYEIFNHWFDVSAVKNGDGFILTFHDITEQKQAENEVIKLKEALTKRATDKYRKIIDSMDEGFCILEIISDESGACTDYRFLDTNPVFESQTGLYNVLGKKMNELVPRNETHWKEMYAQVAATGKSVRFEDYSDALGRWFDVNAFRVDAPNEQHVAIIFKNITERKEAEVKNNFLFKLNEALRPIIDPGKIQETAMQLLGAHLEVNRANFSEILEDEDTLVGREGYADNVDPFIKPIKISDFNPELHQQLLEGETLVVEDLLKAYDLNENAKEVVHYSEARAIIAVPYIKDHKLQAVVAVQQKNPRKWTSHEIELVKEVCHQTWEVMDKAHAEKALRESEQKFRNLVEGSALADWETEPDGSIFKDSITWRKFTGQSFDDWIGNGWLNAVYEEDKDSATEEWKEAVRTQTKYDAEYRVISASGEPRWTSAKATPIYNSEGEIIKWSGMNIDIHDRKQTEEELKKAKEEAEAASRAKEDFLSTMSHEIRTPLNAVIGLTNLLLDKNPREDQKENLNSLSFSAKNLLALINDILDFSKLEAGKAELTITDFDLHSLLLNLQQAHLPLAQDKNTQLMLHMDSQIPKYIAADQLKLSQVLHNLVSNAVKFTSHGKVSITVELSRSQEDKLWLQFEVKDTGIGISEEKLEHIFEKFSQAESSTVRQYGGTGLGLSITRLLLKLMDSNIKLESSPGKGSLFYFELPVSKANSEQAIAAPVIKAEENKDLKDLKVLLVEDVEINRKIINQFLQNWWQLEPDEAKNGEEAVNMAKQQHYDIILMDIRMPVMDGYEAAKIIRSLEEYQTIPILALTADKNQEVEQEGQLFRFDDLLTKPFEPLDLKKKILQHLTSNQQDCSTAVDAPLNNSEEKVVQDQENSEEFLPFISHQLQQYRKSFKNGLEQQNIQLLEQLQRESAVICELLQLDKISGAIQDAMNFIKNDAQEAEKNEVLRSGDAEFEKAIEKAQREIKEPVCEISRYIKLAGKNPEVLQKLVRNSTQALQTYEAEFKAGAEDRSIHRLSDLIHKSTTTIHYVQALRLDRKIREFRKMLEDQTELSEDLYKQKQQEVINEFRLVIGSLKSFENLHL